MKLDPVPGHSSRGWQVHCRLCLPRSRAYFSKTGCTFLEHVGLFLSSSRIPRSSGETLYNGELQSRARNGPVTLFLRFLSDEEDEDAS